MSARLLLVDDHTLFRTGLRLIVQDHPSVSSIAEAGSVAEACALQLADADLVLLDIQLPGMSGLDGLRLLRQACPRARIVLVSASVAPDAIIALLLLASFRLAMLLEWLPWLLAFPVAALVDGCLVRVVKAKEFLHHSPEMFALYACLAILTSCATVLAFVLPFTLHPLAVPCVPVVIGTLMGTAIRDFHARI